MYYSVFIIGMDRPTYTYISVSTLSQGFHIAHFFYAHCKSMRSRISNLHVMPKKKKKHSDSRVYTDLRTERKKSQGILL